LTDYEAWIEGIRAELQAIPDDAAAEDFLEDYRRHQPFMFTLPKDWPALRWHPSYLTQRVGDRKIQIQGGRLADPDYEIKSDRHRRQMTFGEFLALLKSAQANDLYLTAQNGDDQGTRGLIAALANDLRPVPPYLADNPESAFLWLGKDTLTPTHHDTATVLMCQIWSLKQVRLVSPDDWRLVRPRGGVYSWLEWVDDDIPHQDFWLYPGQGLCLPCGWWHCVRAYGVSLTVTFTNLLWGNNFHTRFRAADQSPLIV
jgi:hypothetical protein